MSRSNRASTLLSPAPVRSGRTRAVEEQPIPCNGGAYNTEVVDVVRRETNGHASTFIAPGRSTDAATLPVEDTKLEPSRNVVVSASVAKGQPAVRAGNDCRAGTGHGDMRRANGQRSGAESIGDSDTHLISADTLCGQSRAASDLVVHGCVWEEADVAGRPGLDAVLSVHGRVARQTPSNPLATVALATVQLARGPPQLNSPRGHRVPGSTRASECDLRRVGNHRPPGGTSSGYPR
jgi:hypothetical protein